MPGAIQVLGKLLNWSIKEGPPPREYAGQSGCRMAEPGGASLPAVSLQLLRGEHGSVGVLWWPPPPLSRLGWAWLHAASAGLGEVVSAPGLVSVAVSELFWRKKPSPQILKGA